MKKMPRFVAPSGTIRRNNRGDAGTSRAQYAAAKQKTEEKKNKAQELREKMKAQEWGQYGKGSDEEEEEEEEEEQDDNL